MLSEIVSRLEKLENGTTTEPETTCDFAYNEQTAIEFEAKLKSIMTATDYLKLSGLTSLSFMANRVRQATGSTFCCCCCITIN